MWGEEKHISVLDQETQLDPIWEKEKVDNCDLIVALSVITENIQVHYVLLFQCQYSSLSIKLSVL